MKFDYQARTLEGQVQAGTVEAASKEAALRILQKYGLYVTSLEEKVAPFYAKRIKILERISKKDIVLFSRQVAIMFKSEISLVEALQVLASQATNPDFREKILTLSEDIEGGTSLSLSLARYPKIFNPFFINMVKSGETAGKLSEVLEYLADHLEKEYNFQSKMRGAMLYPLVIFFVASIVFALMIFFVIPQLSLILKEAGGELPLPTQIVIGLAEFLRSKWWLLIGGLAGVVILMMRYARTAEGKKNFDRLLLKLPLIGDFSKKIYLARFAENLSTLIAGGLHIAQALELSGEVVGNTVYKEIIFQTRNEVRKGETISSVLRGFPDVFPPMFSQMVLVGEKTGALDKSLQNVVTFYQAEVTRTMENLLSLLEPALIVSLGLIVAVVIAAVLMPLYQITGI